MSAAGEAKLQYILDSFGNVIYYTHADIFEEEKLTIEDFIQKVENTRQKEIEEDKGQEHKVIAGMWEGPVKLAGRNYVALRYSAPSGYSYCTLLPETQLNARKMANMLTVTIFILLRPQ